MPPVRSIVALGVALAIASVVAAPASAETLYLKNGTRVVGKIVKQTDEAFELQTPQGNVKVAKDDVAIQDLPDPDIALIMGIGFPGAGNAYTNRYDQALFNVAIAAIGFAGIFALVQQAGNYAQGQRGLPILAGTGAAAIPWGLGAYEAYLEARHQDSQPKFKIDYSDVGP